MSIILYRIWAQSLGFFLVGLNENVLVGKLFASKLLTIAACGKRMSDYAKSKNVSAVWANRFNPQKMFNFQQKFFEFETCYKAASKPLDIRVYKSYKGKVCLCLTHKALDLSFKIFKGMNSATICYLAANFHKYIPRQ